MWSAACLVAALTTSSPAYRLVVVLAATAMLTALPVAPGLSRRPLVMALSSTGGLAILFNLLLSHTGATVLFAIPDWLPLLGGPVSLEAAAFGAATGLGIAAAILAVAPLVLHVEAGALMDALPRHLERTAAALAATFALAPALGRSYTSIREAQIMRGWRPQGLRSWAEVMVPVALTAVESSLLVAEAMEARAFGAGPRTPPEPIRWRARDIVTIFVALIAAALFLGSRIVGLQEDWLVYPTPAPPPADPPLLAAAALLALPALLVWRRSRG